MADLARDIMRRKVHTIGPKATLPELERQLVDARITGCPVVEGERLVGVVSRSDVIRQLCVERSIAEMTSDYYRDDMGFHEVPLDSFNDIADRVGERIESLRVADVMNRKLFVVSPRSTVREVTEKLVEHQIHRVPVTDDGILLGIISAFDFVRLFADGKASLS